MILLDWGLEALDPSVCLQGRVRLHGGGRILSDLAHRGCLVHGVLSCALQFHAQTHHFQSPSTFDPNLQLQLLVHLNRQHWSQKHEKLPMNMENLILVWFTNCSITSHQNWNYGWLHTCKKISLTCFSRGCRNVLHERANLPSVRVLARKSCAITLRKAFTMLNVSRFPGFAEMCMRGILPHLTLSWKSLTV